MDSVQHYIKEGILYEPIIPNIHQWPIAQLFQEKPAFVKEVIQYSMEQLHAQAGFQSDLKADILARTMYLERTRMKENPWKVDPKDEGKFWTDIKKRLVHFEQYEDKAEIVDQGIEAMMNDVVSRYAYEIASDFKPGVYHFAKRFLPLFFSTLLNASAGKTFQAVIKHSVKLQERVHLMGHVDHLRKLGKKGTIILVPTHISNVDSILVGWGLHALGMPAFIYGAGLNLYNNKILAHFMNRLGAYTVDRRKRNPIYRATLDSYATIATLQGVHGIFFPGGTRSRSGAIEKHLKLGLLSTALEAQRRNFIYPVRAQSEKVFIVPLVMSYHFVLEAASLIRQHLKHTGEEQYYILDKESGDLMKVLKFAWSTFSRSSDIVLSFGKPMDVLGNFVDEEGHSLNDRGQSVDVKSYFMTGGQVTKDPQRDQQYTRHLGERIVERYHIENHVFNSHLVAFAAFEHLKKKHKELDLYALLRLPEDDRRIPMDEFQQIIERLYQRLREMQDAGRVHLAQHMVNDIPTIVQQGVANLGIYHEKRPMRIQRDGSLSVESMNLLYYYHNRLEGYELEFLV